MRISDWSSDGCSSDLGLQRQRRAGRRPRPQVLRRGCPVDGRSRELLGADAGGDADLARRREHDRQPWILLCEGREMKRFRNAIACLPLACLLLAAEFAAPAQEPLPRDSVYQLPATLTEQEDRKRVV